jgi:hypothetical protein
MVVGDPWSHRPMPEFEPGSVRISFTRIYRQEAVCERRPGSRRLGCTRVQERAAFGHRAKWREDADAVQGFRGVVRTFGSTSSSSSIGKLRYILPIGTGGTQAHSQSSRSTITSTPSVAYSDPDASRVPISGCGTTSRISIRQPGGGGLGT